MSKSSAGGRVKESINEQKPNIMKKQEQHTQSFPLPWDRFWARCIDLLIHFLILFLIFIFLRIFLRLNDYPFDSSLSMKLLIATIVWAIVSVEFLLYESLFLHFFGATPGKALFRIKVTDSEGQNLSFRMALVRAIYVCWFGHYFSLLTIDGYIIGYWFSSRHYKKTGNFRWNIASNSIVLQKPLTLLRRRLLILFAFFCLVLREIPLLIALIKLFEILTN
jgi:uncharacterized RDD family membrane protein YckC